MKKYFAQFGRVLRLRLSRNKTTGASKHFAFVEFASGEVADIVARTMDNYLLFGHILRCKLIPTEQVREDLFKGAGQRFKVDPRNKKAGLEMERGVERAQWEKRVERENKRRTGKSKFLKESLGYEFEALSVKSVDEVPKQGAVENGEAQQIDDVPMEDAPAIEDTLADEEAPVDEEQAKPKKGTKRNARSNKKDAKATEAAVVEPEAAVEVVEPVAAVVVAEPGAVVVVKPGAPVEVVAAAPAKKAKKDKKRKSDVALDIETPAEETPATEKAPRGKRAKKEPQATTVTDDGPADVKAAPAVAKPKKAKKAKASA
jgi:nucleolar protein 15